MQNFLATIWPLVEILRVVYVKHKTKTVSGKLIAIAAIGFAATMRHLSNYFDLLFLFPRRRVLGILMCR